MYIFELYMQSNIYYPHGLMYCAGIVHCYFQVYCYIQALFFTGFDNGCWYLLLTFTCRAVQLDIICPRYMINLSNAGLYDTRICHKSPCRCHITKSFTVINISMIRCKAIAVFGLWEESTVIKWRFLKEELVCVNLICQEWISYWSAYMPTDDDVCSIKTSNYNEYLSMINFASLWLVLRVKK